MQHRSTGLVLSVVIVAAAAHAKAPTDAPPELTVEFIMRDAKWIGTSPSQVRWSEAGSEIYFRWNPDNEEESSLYAVSRDGGEPRRLSDQERRVLPPTAGDYDSQRRRKVYEKSGDIFLLEIIKDRIRQITNTNERESDPAFSGDGRKITYRSDDNLFLIDLTNGGLTQLTDFQGESKPSDKTTKKTEHQNWIGREEARLFETHQRRKENRERRRKVRRAMEPDRPKRIRIGAAKLRMVQLSPNEQFVSFRLEDQPEVEVETIVANYVDASGFTEPVDARPKVGAPQSTFRFGIYDRERDTVYYISTGDIPGIDEQPDYLQDHELPEDSSASEVEDGADPEPHPVNIHGPIWSEDGVRAVVVVVAQDHKDRWIMSLDLATAKLSLLDRQRDEAWIGGPGISGWWGAGDMGWLADNKTIWFQSEATGYSHLYTMNVETGERRQHTDGAFEVRDAQISRDKKTWYFVSNQVHPGERHFYRLSVKGGKPEQVTSLPGQVRVEISPDEKQLALMYSRANRSWELYLQRNRPGAEARRLTHSISEEYLSYSWRDPEIITFPAEDGAEVYARIYHPKDGPKNGAAVVFVHGAGYMQNIVRGWTQYFREMMFHNLLADRGYTVLDIDYRGSAGYGRDWRTGIYRHMGGKDLSDQVDGVKYLVDNYGIDPKRVGIYGGSYGGFITLMAMFTEPDVFAAGAGLRSVTDWAHYNHSYTSNILNLPYTDSLAYVRSSPIYFAEGLQGALLICHGMVDTNVHFQDVVRLAQRLIELGKNNWEMAVYPAEAHSFKDPSSWTDEYKRILKLFEENL